MSSSHHARQSCQIAQNFLDGTVSATECVRSILAIWPERPPLGSDPNLLIMETMDRITASFPVGASRSNWDVNSLNEKDRERLALEATYGEALAKACRYLIEQYS